MSDSPKDPPHNKPKENQEENDEPLESAASQSSVTPEIEEVSAVAITRQEMRRMICDIEESVIEEFLLLIRNNYGQADKAMFFLEQRSGILNLQAITNIRDVLSHLATMLNPKLSEQQRREQLGNIEEHLRRAIIEPYEIALSDLMKKFGDMHEEYKRVVTPIQDKHPALQHAPNAVSIKASMREIGELTAKGRTGKGKNLWNDEWEKGVTSFVDAFDKLTALQVELEGYLFKAQQIEHEFGQTKEVETLKAQLTSLRTQTKSESVWSTLLHIGGYALAIILFLIVLMYPSLPDKIRSWMHPSNAPSSTTQPQR